VKHLGREAWAKIDPFLEQLRAVPGLKNPKSRANFHYKSKAFLHFHDDPEGLFVDVKLDGKNWTRMNATTAAGKKQILAAVLRAVGQS
jgi:hypothetical protein